MTIDAGAGNDEIQNSYSYYVSIAGGAGKDSIYSYNGYYSTINGGAGNDLISLADSATNKLIQYTSGDGNDTIWGFKATDTLSISGGSYSMQSSGNDLLVKVGTGTIRIKNAYAAVDKVQINKKSIALKRKTIKLSGNNSVEVGRDSISVVGSAERDTIYNYGGNYVTINAGAEDDSIDNTNGSNVSINAGNGDDEIYNYSGHNVTIDGGKGYDYIYSTGGDSVSIAGAAGNDTIRNSGGNDITINGGAGKDLISLNASIGKNLIQYAAGDGNDTIYGFNSTSTLQIGSGTGTYSTQASGYDVLVKVGKEAIRLKNVYTSADALHINGDTITFENKIIKLTGSNNNVDISRNFVSVVGSSERDTINNYGNDVTISSGAEDDYVYNYYGSSVLINVGNGDDSVDNYYGSNATINGGAGYDTIENANGEGVSISGGAGNDYISNYGDYATINGGKGNDTISLYSYSYNNVIEYASGDGNDVIEGFNEYDTLNISGGTHSTTKSGDNIIVKVGKGKITLSGAANLESMNIINSTPLTITNKTKSPVTLEADTKAANASTRTTAIKITGNVSDNSIIGGSGKDTIYGDAGDDSILGNAGNDKLYGQAGNDTTLSTALTIPTCC